MNEEYNYRALDTKIWIDIHTDGHFSHTSRTSPIWQELRVTAASEAIILMDQVLKESPNE